MRIITNNNIENSTSLLDEQGRAKWDPKKCFNSTSKYVPGHSEWLSGQFDLTGLKKPSEATGLLLHMQNNQDRHEGKDLLNPHPAFRNLVPNDEINRYIEELANMKEQQRVQREFNKKHHRKLADGERIIDTSKSAKAGRFGVVQLNLNPNNKANKEAIKYFFEQLKARITEVYPPACCFTLHMNEVSPGVHFFVPAYEIKNERFEFYKSGIYTRERGKERVIRAHRIVEDLNKELATKFNCVYIQEPTTQKGQDREIAQFRKGVAKIEQHQQMSKDEKRALSRVVNAEVKKLSQANKTQSKQSTASKIWDILQQIKQLEKSKTFRGSSCIDSKGYIAHGREVEFADLLAELWEKDPAVKDWMKQQEEKAAERKGPISGPVK